MCSKFAPVRERALFARPSDSTGGGRAAAAGGARPRRSQIPRAVRNCARNCISGKNKAQRQHSKQTNARIRWESKEPRKAGESQRSSVNHQVKVIGAVRITR